MVDVVVAVGRAPLETFRQLDNSALSLLPDQLTAYEGDVMCWVVQSGQAPFRMRVLHARAERLRHIRKYAVGNLKSESFWFRGSKQVHNLSASNLSLFCHIGRGIDEETCLYHLRRGDYSRWIRASVKDEDLTELVQQIEQNNNLSPQDTRSRIRDAIEARYTLGNSRCRIARRYRRNRVKPSVTAVIEVWQRAPSASIEHRERMSHAHDDERSHPWS
jgi:hypothetical protein